MPVGKGKEVELEKIQSDFLRRETAEAHSEPHTVIVELSLPHPKVQVSRAPDGGLAKRAFLADMGGNPEETKRYVSQVRKSLEKIIGHKTDAFFPSSSAFVVSATGEQLRAIANLDHVSAIWPNDLKSGA
ncbi:MAG TPA: hypothetical protein VJT13_03645 [Xanthobacteraceae bacterium]|nr:hypothetical protein [Xanthobacteraceae bacterium]